MEKLEYRNFITNTLESFPDKWGNLYQQALESGSNFTGVFTDDSMINPPEYDNYIISMNYIMNQYKTPQLIDFISPSFCKFDGQEYKTHINSAHEVLLPSHTKQNKEPMFITPDFNWADHRGYETPIEVVQDFVNHVSNATKELMTADMRKEKAKLFVTPVYFSVSALGPVLSAEIWTWTGMLIPMSSE